MPTTRAFPWSTENLPLLPAARISADVHPPFGKNRSFWRNRLQGVGKTFQRRPPSSVALARITGPAQHPPMADRAPLTPEQVRFEIRFALGQAPAGIYADIRRGNPIKREEALDRLADKVAARFEKMIVTPDFPVQQPQSISHGWSGR